MLGDLNHWRCLVDNAMIVRSWKDKRFRRRAPMDVPNPAGSPAIMLRSPDQLSEDVSGICCSEVQKCSFTIPSCG